MATQHDPPPPLPPSLDRHLRPAGSAHEQQSPDALKIRLLPPQQLLGPVRAETRGTPQLFNGGVVRQQRRMQRGQTCRERERERAACHHGDARVTPALHSHETKPTVVVEHLDVNGLAAPHQGPADAL